MRKSVPFRSWFFSAKKRLFKQTQIFWIFLFLSVKHFRFILPFSWSLFRLYNSINVNISYDFVYITNKDVNSFNILMWKSLCLKNNSEIKIYRLWWGDFFAKIRGGSVAEWLKAHDSKSCGPKGLGGSNPLASAINVGTKKTLKSLFSFLS